MPNEHVPLGLLRQAFFEKVICVASVKRFVAYAPGLNQSEGYGASAKIERIWVPNHADEPYNLVLSLATNGRHYPLLDWDRPERPTLEGRAPSLFLGDQKNVHWFRSASGNWHAYAQMSFNFSNQVTTAKFPVDEDWEDEQLGKIPGSKLNQYHTHVEKNGFAALRPPWWGKAGVKPYMVFDDAIPEGFLDGIKEPEPEKTPWEELFDGE
jgi:hypothetical protein